MNQPATPCRGLLIVFEGLDGAGKTTQLGLLEECLRSRGRDVVCLREPTEGAVGAENCGGLMLQGRGDVTPDTELEWFLNDRREHIDQKIRPALDRKTNRPAGSLFLFDHGLSGRAGDMIPRDIQARNEAFAPLPDLLLLLDLPPAVGWQAPEATRRAVAFRKAGLSGGKWRKFSIPWIFRISHESRRIRSRKRCRRK